MVTEVRMQWSNGEVPKSYRQRSVDNSGYPNDVVMALDHDQRGEGLWPGSVHEPADEHVLDDGFVRQVLTHLFAVQECSFL